MGSVTPLAGLADLVLEDEPLIASELVERLVELGAQVVAATTLKGVCVGVQF